MAETAAPKKPLRFRNYRPADATLAPSAAAATPGKAGAAASEANNDGGGGKKGAAAAGNKAPQQQQQQQPVQQPPEGEGQQQQPPTKKAGPGQGQEESVIKRELRRHLEEHGGEGGQLNVAPRKPNWDLKRDVAKKMEKLNRLTQKAVVELLREKLAREAEEEGSSEEEEDDEEED